MAGFESFSRELRSLKPEPRLVIQKRGILSLNRSAYLLVGAPAAVELLYDRSATILGLRTIAAAAGNAYHLRRTGTSTTGPWLVSAMAFLKFYEIDTTVSRQWRAYLEDGVLCADLSRPGTPVTSNRAARDQPG